MNKTKIVILTGAVLGIAAGIWILSGALSDKDLKWGAAGLIYLAALLFSAWGMWHLNRLALGTSFLAAAASFGFGAYITHFRWTFWLWKEPTLMDRLLSVTVQNLGGVLFILLPILWILFFARPKITSQFH